jgi:hypothetical protein
MSIIRPFRADDLFRFNNINLDIWTETVRACCVPHNTSTLLPLPRAIPLPRPSRARPKLLTIVVLPLATHAVWPRLLFQLPLALARHVLHRRAPQRAADGIRLGQGGRVSS